MKLPRPSLGQRGTHEQITVCRYLMGGDASVSATGILSIVGRHIDINFITLWQNWQCGLFASAVAVSMISIVVCNNN